MKILVLISQLTTIATKNYNSWMNVTMMETTAVTTFYFTKFKQFETIETTEYFCENRMKEVECEVVCLPDRPVLNAIQVEF